MTTRAMKTFALLAAGMFLAGAIAVPDRARAAEPSDVDEQFDLYWGKQREIRVIQKRTNLKEASWELGFGAGVIPNDDFWLYFPLQLSAGYYFAEDVGVELGGAYIIKSKSDLNDFLLNEAKVDVTLPQHLVWRAGINGLWSPFHGKVGLFATKLFHFDFSVIAGIGAVGTTITDGREEKGKVDVSGNLGAGFRTWFNDDMALRIEYRHYIYPAEGGGVSFPAEFMLAFSYFTGGYE